MGSKPNRLTGLRTFVLAALTLGSTACAPAATGPGAGPTWYPDIELLRDPTRALGIEGVRSSSARFERLGRAPMGLGFTSDALWLRFEIPAGLAPQTFDVCWDYPLAEHLDLYLEDGRGGIEHRRGGVGEPAERRTIEIRGQRFATEIRLGPRERRRAWIRVEGRTSMVLAPSVWEPQALRRRERIEFLLYGLDLALAAWIALSSLSHVGVRNDRVRFGLAAMGATFGAYELSFAGLFAYLFAGWPRFVLIGPVLFGGLAAASATFFSRAYLDLRRHEPRLDRIAGVAAGAGVIASVSSLGWRREGAALVASCAFVALTAVVIGGARLAMRGDRTARAFGLLWSLFLAGASAMVLALLGVLPMVARFTDLMRIFYWLGAVGLIVPFTRRLERAHLASDEALARSEEEREREAEQRRLAEEHLRQSQKMEAVGRLAGGVAHDFNNLLTAISTSSYLAREELPVGSPAAAYLEDVDDAVRRASGLTRQLLAFSRRQVLEPRPLDLNAHLGGMKGVLARILGEDVELVLDPGPGLSPVVADPTQFEQVVLNLAVNARDAMPRGGRVTMSTQAVEIAGPGSPARPGRFARLEVRDTGEGMPPEVLERIFEPFFTTKLQGKGTGLGLATVYGIVRQHGGTVEVSSELGRGSVFRVLLPTGGTVPEAAEHGSQTPIPRGAGTILLTEDEPAVRDSTRRLLERVGYRVLSAGAGEEALRIGVEHQGPIDLLLTDVVMPRMNGRDLAAALRRARPGLRVLFMSGYAGDVLTERGALLPGITLLNKPFTPEDLTRRVAEAMRGRPATG
jgi:signal transduction histidine kinase/ActR/RegA family two-component response regulator